MAKQKNTGGVATIPDEVVAVEATEVTEPTQYVLSETEVAKMRAEVIAKAQAEHAARIQMEEEVRANMASKNPVVAAQIQRTINNEKDMEEAQREFIEDFRSRPTIQEFKKLKTPREQILFELSALKDGNPILHYRFPKVHQANLEKWLIDNPA